MKGVLLCFVFRQRISELEKVRDNLVKQKEELLVRYGERGRGRERERGGRESGIERERGIEREG